MRKMEKINTRGICLQSSCSSLLRACQREVNLWQGTWQRSKSLSPIFHPPPSPMTPTLTAVRIPHTWRLCTLVSLCTDCSLSLNALPYLFGEPLLNPHGPSQTTALGRPPSCLPKPGLLFRVYPSPINTSTVIRDLVTSS